MSQAELIETLPFKDIFLNAALSLASLHHCLPFLFSLSFFISLFSFSFFCSQSSSPSLVPGPVASLTAIPSFFKICYTWREPQAPNGIITDYSIQYASSGSSSTSTILGSQNSFRTPDSYDMGSQVNLTVVAFTAAGSGAPTAITATTLTRPREYCTT